jgi:release factor glutamine methyltransferase
MIAVASGEPVADALRRAAARLAAAGIDQPGREARLLLRHALGLPADAPLDPAAVVDLGAFETLLRRRAGREPMAFILGQQGFWTLDLEVSPATLIPRADSETLIMAAIAALPDRAQVRRVLDLGTGTGALLLAALAEFPAAQGIGVDRVPAAAALAARNARRGAAGARALFICGDWAAPIAGRFDLVLCNPPYIRSEELPGLMPEVARHEPAAALDGGADGLDAYRVVLAGLASLLSASGIAVLELGQGQAEAVARLAAAHGLAEQVRRADLGGVVRALVLRTAAQGKKSFGIDPVGG